MNTWLKNTISNSIDLHVHIGPEIIPRKYNVEKLGKVEKGKLYGAVLKNHFYPTSPLIKSYKAKNLKMFGSIVLNNFVGGLNKEAVYSASLLTDSPIIVWLPTINASHFLTYSKYEIPPEWVGNPSILSRNANSVRGIKVIDKYNNISPKAIGVLEIIKETNSILATGHISWQESVILVEKAVELGIRKIIITHPIYQRIKMPINVQKKLSKLGAIIEQCYSMYAIDKISIGKIASQIKELGSENCFISSDTGQLFGPSPSQALYRFSIELLKVGISKDDIERMLINNPRTLVDQD